MRVRWGARRVPQDQQHKALWQRHSSRTVARIAVVDTRTTVVAKMHQVLLGRPMAPLQDKTVVLRRVGSRRMAAAASAVAAQGVVERKRPPKVMVQRLRPQLLGLLVATQTVVARQIITVAVDGVVEQESVETKPTVQAVQQFPLQHLHLLCRCADQKNPCTGTQKSCGNREYAGVGCG